MNTLSSPTRSMKPADTRISRSSNFAQTRTKTIPRKASVFRTVSSASDAGLFATGWIENHDPAHHPPQLFGSHLRGPAPHRACADQSVCRVSGSP